jgi:hypothetical protein
MMRSVSLSRRHLAHAAIATTGLAVAFGVAGFLASAPARAAAAASPTAEVMVIHASQVDGGGTVDPRIGAMPQLSRPPLNAYNAFKLLDKQTLSVPKEHPATYKLPNGRTLQVTLLDVTPDHRFHVRTEINRPNGRPYLKALEVTAAANEPFFVGGQSYAGGTLVVGLTMKP